MSSGFYETTGAAYTEVDPVVVETLRDQAAASASAAAASATSSSDSASASASSAAAAAASATVATINASQSDDSRATSVAAATVAAGQATVATTQAGNASTSASAASASASAASTSAIAAGTSATNAGNSATAAATSASNASTSETNAANSASAASTSATNASTAVQAAAGTATPLVNGTATVGTGTKWAHEDHRHPTDTSRAPLASPAFTGNPTAPTPANGDNSTSIATTAFVLANGGALSNATPVVNGTGTPGVATSVSRADHVHPTDTSRAPLASPTFTGSPAAPTPTLGNNSTLLATTAFVAANAVLTRSAAITLYVSPTGSNSNSGLTVGAPLQTLAFATALAYSTYYTCNKGSITIDGQGGTYQEFITAFYPLNGGGTLIYQNFTWRPANSGYCLQFGDGALVGLTNITFNTVGVTSPVGYIIGHNHGILDVNAGVTFTTGGITGSIFDHDVGGGGGTQFNINNGLTVTNSGASCGGFLYRGQQPLMRFNINGPHVFTGSPQINRFAWASQGTRFTFQGNVTFTGTYPGSASLLSQGAGIQNLSGATLPGGTPTPTSGATYNTAIDP